MAASDVMALETVIRRVEKQTTPPQRGESYLSIRQDTGEINPGMLGKLTATVHHYCVSTERSGKPSAESKTGILHVADPDSPQDVANLRIAFQATCPDENAERLVKSLGRHGDPDGQLNAIVMAAARKAIWGDERKLFSDFETMRMAIVNAVEDEVVAETGLRFRAQIVLEDAGNLGPEPVNERLEVRFKDTPITHRLQVQGDLDVDPRLTLKAIVRFSNLNRLRHAFIQAVKDYFRLEVNAQEYAVRFKDTAVLPGLEQRVAGMLRAEGRVLTGLSLTVIDGDKIPPLEVKHPDLPSEVTPLNREKPIQLNSQVLLVLKNYGRYLGSPEKDIEQWLRNEFRKVTDAVCFQKQLLDFLKKDTWAEIAASIKTEMEARAQQVGYKLEQILSSPVMEENRFSTMRHHPFPIGDLPLKSTSRALVALTVDVMFCINEWEDDRLIQKINQGIDLKVDIEAQLRDALAQELVKVPPNDFFLRFNAAANHDGTLIEGGSLEARLGETVKKRLETDYGAKVSGVVITQVETDEIKKIRELMFEPTQFSFIATPTSGGSAVNFHATWQVVGLSDTSWEKIRRESCNRANIQSSLDDILKSGFSTFAHEELRYVPEDDRVALESYAQRLANGRGAMPDLHGVYVSIASLRRDPVEEEEALNKTLKVKFTDKVQRQEDHIRHTAELDQMRRDQETRLIRTTYQTQQTALLRLQKLRDIPASARQPEQQDELDDLEKREDLRKALAALDAPPPEVEEVPSDPRAYHAAMLKSSSQSGGGAKAAIERRATQAVQEIGQTDGDAKRLTGSTQDGAGSEGEASDGPDGPTGPASPGPSMQE